MDRLLLVLMQSINLLFDTLFVLHSYFISGRWWRRCRWWRRWTRRAVDLNDALPRLRSFRRCFGNLGAGFGIFNCLLALYRSLGLHGLVMLLPSRAPENETV